VVSITDIPEKKELGLANLPCFGSRGIIAGWYSVLDDALRDSDWNKVLKLYEAALCLPMQVRCGPTIQQVLLDSITYSEDLYAANSGTSDAFLTFAEKVISALPPGFLQTKTAKNVVERAASLGISFHGSAVGDSVARALINVAPFVISPDFQKAFRAFEEVSPALNDQTKISFLTSACTKLFLTNACTKAHGKTNSAATEACVEVLHALRAGLLYKDIATDSHLTKEFLTGGRHKAGFVHWFLKRKAFIDFIQVLVGSLHGRFADEAKEKIFPKLTSIKKMEKEFTGPITQAGSGDEQVRSTSRRAIFGKLSSAVGEADEDEAESEALTGVGLGYATMKAFGVFSNTLSSSGQLLATILWKTHGCQFDEEFRLIANAEVSSVQFTFPWAELLSIVTAASKNKSKELEKPQHKVGGIFLPLLRESCGTWIESTLSQPSDLGGDKSAVGDEDQAFDTATKNNDDAFAGKRKLTIDALEELFQTKVRISSFPGSPITKDTIIQVLQKC
jgi:hypothetical protein